MLIKITHHRYAIPCWKIIPRAYHTYREACNYEQVMLFYTQLPQNRLPPWSM